MKKNKRSQLPISTFDDRCTVRSIEEIFLKKRKSVFTMPAPGTSVILLVSGGLDSTLTWGLLLAKYKLRVFPLYLNKGERRANKEEQSVDYFSHFYSKKYPGTFITPEKHTIFLPQKEIITKLKTPFDNLSKYDKAVTKHFAPTTTSNIFLGSPGIVPFYALFYARYLELLSRVKIRTIFSSVMMGDGTVCPSQTITSLRTINLAMCTFTGEFTWQFTSPSIEPYLHHFFEKKDLIQWGDKHHIPMEHSWSCYRGLTNQCGSCLACISRKAEFKKAHIQDKTRYTIRYRHIIKQSIKSATKWIRRFLITG